MKEKIKNIVYNFFVESNDFNGISLRQISKKLDIDYKESIDIIKELVADDKISIQSSSNPNIIGYQHYLIASQLQILEKAKSFKERIQLIGSIRIAFEDNKFPICLYPSKNYLKLKRDLSEYGNAVYTKELALAEPHLKPIFFDLEVLDRYLNDPRFNFEFYDYSGEISYLTDDKDKSVVREEDEIFLKTFGLGFDSGGNKMVVVFLRYLKDLTPEHQVYWRSKENFGECRILEEYYQNSIEGNWNFSYSVFSAFIGEQKCINDLSNVIFSKPLFRKTFENEKKPKEFLFFFTPTLKNFNDFVLLLDKMISDNLNKDFFKGKVEFFYFEELEPGVVERKNKGTLKLLEEWLTSEYVTKGDSSISQLLRPFRKIREDRQNPAHKIDENKYDRKYIEAQTKIIGDAYQTIRNLRKIFQRHPDAVNFQIPSWLDEGQIKNF